ncbi:LysR family transcriptional regulator [Haliea sp. E17]|uniref:LysR family transcriptional regulator n=1 Tax=Haliea sp. E17 TaxID=3401576 RepID=UPI003AAB546A
MDIELKRLEQVLVVARTGSFSRAAEELHITQPALSRSIGVLEERYGLRIFERGRGGAVLTAVGRQVAREAESVLRSARAADHNLRLFSAGESGRIAVGMGPLIASLALPIVGLRCLRERPKLAVQVVTRPPTLLYRELMEDGIELLFCSARQLDGFPDIEETALGEIAISTIVRAGHPLAATGRATPEEIAGYPLLTGAEVQSALPLRDSGSFICDNYEVLRQMTLASDGIWISSNRLVEKELAQGNLVPLQRIDSTLPERVPVYMVSRTGEQLSPAAAALRDYVQGYLSAG